MSPSECVRGNRIVDTVEIALHGPLSMIVTGYKLEDRNKNKPPKVEKYVEIPQTKEELLSLNEASARLPYTPRIPGYLPEGFKLDKIKLRTIGTGVSILTLFYVDQGGKSFSLDEQNIVGDMGFGSTYDRDDTIVSRVQISKNSTGIIKDMKGKLAEIPWIENDIYFVLYGELPAKEAVKVARSLEELR